MTNLSRWIRGRYPCLLVHEQQFKENQFKQWAKKTVNRAAPALAEIEDQIAPEIVLNLLATYKVLAAEDRKLRRNSKRKRKTDARLLRRVAKAIDRQRPALRYYLGSSNAVMVRPDELREWAELLERPRKSSKPQACVLALAELFERRGLGLRWELIHKLGRAAFSYNEWFSGPESIRKIRARLRFQHGPDDSLFSPPGQNGLALLLGPPTARERLLLLQKRIIH